MSAPGPTAPRDPFGTAVLRGHVLDAWAASPARFREDANAEEDAALGAYHDRLVVELVQNAVDAAAVAGVPARVLLRLSGNLLEAANTGAPLTSAGVEALATLRASAKRDPGSVGRFGVGFAAVLAVSDTPAILSAAPGGVRWSRAGTLALAGALPPLADELARRDGAVPVLRLPFPCGPEVAGPPDGYDTVVRLPLRDEEARALARRLLKGTDPTLPLTLPGLVELTVEVDGARRTLTCAWDGDDAFLDGRRWWGVARRGGVPAELLADRPVEERIRTGYEIRALVPDGDWPPAVPRVLRAPQPTDEPLSLPVLLSVPLPLEPNRRHTVGGPLRDWLLERAAAAVAALAARLGGAAALALVPTGLPVGEVDGRLRAALAALLSDAPVFPAGRRGRECAVLDLGPAADLVAAAAGDALPGLLPGWYAAPRHRPALDLLGVRRLSTTDLVEALSGLRRPGHWWAGLYAALAPAPDREALG
ncbi:MAG TPA: molecular chaperone Hsp90, partial [Frankiaceae bacterium]|nr:molecular chaperone Hsp90 [Frankiaceae bacterium]